MTTDNHPSIDHAMRIIKRIREIARDRGWAIGVHGSLMRDIDLIAVPWTAEACSTSDLIATIMAEFGMTAHGGNPSWRAHNRRTFLLLADNAESQQERFNEGRDPGPVHPKGIWYPPAIDLSVMDPREVKCQEVPEDARAAAANAYNDAYHRTMCSKDERSKSLGLHHLQGNAHLAGIDAAISSVVDGLSR